MANDSAEERQRLIDQRRAELGGNLMAGAGSTLGAGISGENAPSKIKPFTKEERARTLADAVRENYSYYLASEGEERASYRNLALDYHRSLVELVGEQEALRLEQEAASGVREQSNTEQDTGPSLDQLYAYYANHPIHPAGNERITIDPHSIPEDQLRRIYELEGSADATLGTEDAQHVISDFNAGIRGPTQEQLAAMAAVQTEQARQRAADQAERFRVQQERERIRQEFAERQAAAKAAHQAQLDEERRQQSATREAREAQREADRQADRQANAQLRGEQQARMTARDQQAAADRAQREQTAAGRLAAQVDARRRQLTVATLQRAGNYWANSKVRMEALPQPGGIGLLLLVILFFLFAIVQVNASGNTRLQLIWLAIAPWSGLQLPYTAASDAGGTTAPPNTGSGVPGNGSGSGHTGPVPTLPFLPELPYALQTITLL